VGPREDSAHIVHWDGTAWRNTPAAPGWSGLYSIHAISPGDIWATSHSNFLPLIEHWDGIRWSRVPVTLRDGVEELRVAAVGATADGEVWMVGQYAGSWSTLTEHLCSSRLLDSGFEPVFDSAATWGTAAWTLPEANGVSHSVADASGMGLFDSGPRSPGSSFTFTFGASGTYPIVDPASGNKQSIAIPMDAQPSTGQIDTTFDVRWAHQAISGYAFDAQILRPGSIEWEDWRIGATALHDRFRPDAGAGEYSFRARLRNLVNGASSEWSPVPTILVSP
jgi:hypothetical protein